MRLSPLAVAAVAVLAVLAGCLADDRPSASNGSSTSDGPAPNVPVAIDGTDLSAFAGFRVDSVHTGFNGPEPSIGVTLTGAVFATALETIVRSTDAGLTWEPVHTMLTPTFDPMLWVDPMTGRVLSPQMFPVLLCSSLILSDDDGATWVEVPGASCGSPGVDHQKVASGPYPADSPLGVTGPVYPSLVSYCYNKIAGTVCAFSADGGLHYERESLVDVNGLAPQVELQFANCGGLNGHQHHAADGTIYIPYGFGCGQGVVAVSTDAGLSWTIRRLGVGNIALDPEVTSTPDGTVYMLYKSDDGLPHLMRSRDRFVTLEGPFDVAPPNVGTTAFLGMTAGSDGRVVMGYLGTEEDIDGGIEDDADPESTWDAYITMSLDAGSATPHFVTVRANPADDPVQRGSICQIRGCVGGNRNLLDFIDLHAGPDGRFYLAYADGCTSAKCIGPDGKPDDSRDSELTVARLAVGPSLMADKPAFT